MSVIPSDWQVKKVLRISLLVSINGLLSMRYPHLNRRRSRRSTSFSVRFWWSFVDASTLIWRKQRRRFLKQSNVGSWWRSTSLPLSLNVNLICIYSFKISKKAKLDLNGIRESDSSTSMIETSEKVCQFLLNCLLLHFPPMPSMKIFIVNKAKFVLYYLLLRDKREACGLLSLAFSRTRS